MLSTKLAASRACIKSYTFATAQENIVVIAKYRANIAALCEEISKLRQGVDSSAPLLSTSEPASRQEQLQRGVCETAAPPDTDMADTGSDLHEAGLLRCGSEAAGAPDNNIAAGAGIDSQEGRHTGVWL